MILVWLSFYIWRQQLFYRVSNTKMSCIRKVRDNLGAMAFSTSYTWCFCTPELFPPSNHLNPVVWLIVHFNVSLRSLTELVQDKFYLSSQAYFSSHTPCLMTAWSPTLVNSHETLALSLAGLSLSFASYIQYVTNGCCFLTVRKLGFFSWKQLKATT